jgi:hypothetical protein
MVSCCKKIASYESEIRFDPSISDLGDLAIPHAIVNANKIFKLFYTIHYESMSKYDIVHEFVYNNLNKTKTIALLTLKFWQ